MDDPGINSVKEVLTLKNLGFGDFFTFLEEQDIEKDRKNKTFF